MFQFLIILSFAPGDFGLGVEHFNQGNYRTAAALLRQFVADSAYSPNRPEAEYYLLRIQETLHQDLAFVNSAHDYLVAHPLHTRAAEVFARLCAFLADAGAFGLALDYLLTFDYYPRPDSLLRRIGRALIGDDRYADRILQLLPNDDSLVIARARATADTSARRSLLEHLVSDRGRLAHASNSLETGDTLAAALTFSAITEDSLSPDLTLPYLELAQLFDRHAFERGIARLRSSTANASIVRWLCARDSGMVPTGTLPTDERETRLLIAILAHPADLTITCRLPDSLTLDSLPADTLSTISRLDSLRRRHPRNFVLDSAYATILLARGDTSLAAGITEQYLRDPRCHRFARIMRAHDAWRSGRIPTVLSDLLIAQPADPGSRYLLAAALDAHGMPDAGLFRDVAETTDDTLLRRRAWLDYARVLADKGDYQALAGQRWEDLANSPVAADYLYALARTGKRGRADSLYRAQLGEPGPSHQRAYGEYLIEKKLFAQAEPYYDTIIAAHPDQCPSAVWYDRALLAFLRQDYATAEGRFRELLKRCPDAPEGPAAWFKIATIKYALQDYDSAGHYYRKASIDSTLRRDALNNALIAFKKAEEWRRAVEAGVELLPLTTGPERATTMFEIGYAWLRLGVAATALDYLNAACREDPAAEHHYWLAETYLGKGDFLRALYHYEAIKRLYPDDKMWTPTAEFKSGLALEFLGATGEAIRVYQALIKRRGTADVWGSEAQQRLEGLQ